MKDRTKFRTKTKSNTQIVFEMFLYATIFWIVIFILFKDYLDLVMKGM